MKDDVRAVRLRIGKRVKQLRQLRGMSQEKLAELVGNQYKHIGQVERGEVNVGIDILVSIAAHLSVSLSDLIEPAAHSGDERAYWVTQQEADAIQGMAARLKRQRARGRKTN
jgi:transcriptional regulator with XRE-family HTH domain